MRTRPRAGVMGHHWGPTPAKQRAAMAQPRATDRSSPATAAATCVERLPLR